jgi:hypothetical protein
MNQAIQHFQRALRARPDHRDARRNLEMIERRSVPQSPEGRPQLPD